MFVQRARSTHDESPEPERLSVKPTRQLQIFTKKSVEATVCMNAQCGFYFENHPSLFEEHPADT